MYQYVPYQHRSDLSERERDFCFLTLLDQTEAIVFEIVAPSKHSDKFVAL